MFAPCAPCLTNSGRRLKIMLVSCSQACETCSCSTSSRAAIRSAATVIQLAKASHRSGSSRCCSCVVDRLPARRYIATVRVEQEHAPETRGDEALQRVREHPNVGLVVDADGSGKGAVVIRRSHPERRRNSASLPDPPRPAGLSPCRSWCLSREAGDGRAARRNPAAAPPRAPLAPRSHSSCALLAACVSSIASISAALENLQLILRLPPTPPSPRVRG